MISDMIPAGGAAGVLGISYKTGTSVHEESQGAMLAKLLKDDRIDVLAHLPLASGPAAAGLGRAARSFPTAREAFAHQHGAVIVTPSPEYAVISPDWVGHRPTRFIIDCWRQLTPGLFTDRCNIVRMGHQETVSAAVKRLAAE